MVLLIKRLKKFLTIDIIMLSKYDKVWIWIKKIIIKLSLTKFSH